MVGISLRVALVFCLGLLAACGPKVYDEIEMMPAPTVYAETGLSPFANVTRTNVSERTKLFFVTDRMPADATARQAHYNNERGHMLRAGAARVEIDPPLESWEEVKRVTLTENRDQTYALRLSEVDEIGVLPFSMSQYFENAPSAGEMNTAGREFAAQINAQLAKSKNKDIFIYTHGYNVDFDYSTLVSKELQHFLGYQGVFISYNWTATPNRLAYFRDQESVLSTRRNLRALIEYLSDNTNAKKIHLIGYSAGTRLVFEAAYQIALQPDSTARLGRLILIGSDLDTSFVFQSLEDGLLDAVDDVTFYQSQTDSALAVSKFVFGRQRIGQATEPQTIPPGFMEALGSVGNLYVIDVTDAEAASAGNGHSYFQSSPWASSDLFISLLTDKSPGERGLVRGPGEVVWRFPSNYRDVLKSLEKQI